MINLLVPTSLTLGMLCGMHLQTITQAMRPMTTPVICILLLLIGMQIGIDASWMRRLRECALTTAILCLGTVVGSLTAGLVVAGIDPDLSGRDAALVMSGMSFYSVSSIMLQEAGLKTLAVLSLFTNLLREVLSLIAAPYLCRRFGKLAPIAATASGSDSAAPILTRASGNEYVMYCVSTAFVLSLAVPLLTNAILAIK